MLQSQSLSKIPKNPNKNKNSKIRVGIVGNQIVSIITNSTLFSVVVLRVSLYIFVSLPLNLCNKYIWTVKIFICLTFQID